VVDAYDIELLRQRLEGASLTHGVRTGHGLAQLTTYRVGGPAALFVCPDDEAELMGVATALAGTRTPSLVIGRGSNMLVADAGFDGLAIQLGSGFERARVHGNRLTAGGAASLPVVARFSVAEGLRGFEWAVGVPGSIGGAVRMNAGGHGSDMAAVLAEVTLLDLGQATTTTTPASHLNLRYRQSSVSGGQVVTSAALNLEAGERAEGEELIAEIVRWRRENQPGGQNSGSVFANPPGDSAGRLVELAGAKGLRVGSAVVSERHANFIQADQGGSADDIFALMAEVRRRVLEVHGIDLLPETVLVGFSEAP
jgi:UDP-N-acetylmuramate dehydrogenase